MAAFLVESLFTNWKHNVHSVPPPHILSHCEAHVLSSLWQHFSISVDFSSLIYLQNPWSNPKIANIHFEPDTFIHFISFHLSIYPSIYLSIYLSISLFFNAGIIAPIYRREFLTCVRWAELYDIHAHELCNASSANSNQFYECVFSEEAFYKLQQPGNVHIINNTYKIMCKIANFIVHIQYLMRILEFQIYLNIYILHTQNFKLFEKNFNQ